MKNFIKYLKPYTFFILVIVLLLFGQALLNLALPDYMSQIVNVGISQNGVENAVPEIITEDTLQNANYFLTKEESEIVSNNYKLLDEDNKNYEKTIKTFPNAKDFNTYALEDNSKSNIENLDFMKESLFLINAIETGGGEQNKDIFNALPLDIDPDNPFKSIDNMDEDERANFTGTLKEILSNFPESRLKQGAIVKLTSEYELLGADLDKMQTSFIWKKGIIMVLIALGTLIVAASVSFFAARVAANLGKDLRTKLFRQVSDFSLSEFKDFSTSSLITRSTNDIQQVQNLVSNLLRMVFYAPILGIGGLIKALSINISMAWVIGLGLLLVLGLVIVLFSIAVPRFKILQELVDRVNLVLRDSLVGMLVIRAFNNEKYEEEKFETANMKLTKLNLFVSRLMSTMQPTMMLVLNGITILVVWVGAKQIDAGYMQVGDMMAFIQYTTQIIMSFVMLSMVSIILPRATVSLNRVSEVIESDIKIKDPIDFKTLPEKINGEIEFKNVCFKYPDASECVLEEINFKASSGETTAFIGSTGSGKSTLVNLIPRFYDVTEGEILLDGINIKELKLDDLRSRVSYVPQQGVLFTGTIENNIKYSNPKLSDKDMKKVAKISQSEEFISNLSGEYDYPISQGGTNVSGGQRQRLSIARALAAKSEVIIFDDSFSALDFKTDANLRKALKKEVNNTVIIVAQRISTIKDADKILVMNEGRIVGEGTHDYLLKNNKIYQEIAASQLSEEEIA